MVIQKCMIRLMFQINASISFLTRPPACKNSCNNLPQIVLYLTQDLLVHFRNEISYSSSIDEDTLFTSFTFVTVTMLYMDR